MKLKHAKYLLVYSLPLAVAISFTSHGWLTFIPLLHSFALIPLLELLFKPNPTNIDEAERELRKQDSFYDVMLYLLVPVQWGFLIWFLYAVREEGLSALEITGRVFGMGLMCGTIGINVAHELGHRVKSSERFLAKALLLTSLYMHFYVEHNRGHHKNVSTHNDPSSARKNELLYMFWFRSIFTGYISAWRLEAQRLKRKRKSFLSIENEMLQFLAFQIGLILAVYFLFSFWGMIYFVCAAIIGVLLLETVNYIEHYGLVRKKVSDFRYERAMPRHSWNSDHLIGRLMLFELSRHSDHHYQASKKYQILDHHAASPQMPTGYPGMMILANIPPLWFRIMNKRVEYWNSLKISSTD